MSRYTHTIDMIPLDKYHFSDEKKYRSQIKKDKSGKWKRKLVQDYIQRSRVFPQQTTVIGALRYLILYVNGEIPIQNLGAANDLVGSRSWSLQNEKNDLGVIKNISPVMLNDGDSGYDYLINSLHYYSPSAYMTKERELEETNAISDQDKKFVKWRNHNDKTPYDRHLQKVMDSSESIPFFQEKIDSEQDIVTSTIRDLEYGPIVSSERIGIDKVKNQKDEVEAFYKSKDYQMHNESSFRCYANIDIEQDIDAIVPMGADGHLFKIKIVKNECLHKFEKIEPGNHAVTLLSDSFLNNEQYTWSAKQAILIASDVTPFGYIKTVNNKGNDYYTKNPSIGAENDFRLDNAKLQLLKAGSVFYFDNDHDVKQFTDHLKVHEKMRMIGYNMFWNHHYKINK